MGAVFFYHLTRAPLEATLPMLIEKSRGAGWRVVVRGREEAQLDWLDEKLWLGEGFLPHGRAGGPHDADQPVLLTTATDPAPNDAACLMAIDGAEVTPHEVARLQRVCILFDGNDEMALAVARGQWKALTDAGCEAQYWSQDDGGWAMKRKAGGDA